MIGWSRSSGRTAVFKDVDSIPLGINFRKHLDEQVAKCDVFLAIIGPDWTGSKAGEGKSRLDDPRDFVRIEIESALKRQIPVIPVLVRGAMIPDPERLPSSLQELSDRNGIVVRHDPDFHRDMDRLIEHLRVQIAEKLEQAPFPDAHHKTREVHAGTKETRSDVEPLGQERIDAAVPSSKADSPQRRVERVEGKPFASTSASQKTTDQSQSSLFDVIGPVIFIGSMVIVAFLILQSPMRLVDTIRFMAEDIIKYTITLVMPTKQERPVEKRVVTSTPSIPNPEMIRVSLRSFMMGGSEKDETPIHNIQFTKPFAMARYETTFEEYDRFAEATDRESPKDVGGWGRGLRPVINVSWDDAKAYAQWLSQQTGKHYRLPTEAEWEYAARSGGKDETWAGTSDKGQLKNYAVYGESRTQPVGSKKPNGLGLSDMSGNVWEWVEDCWHSNYEEASTDGSAWREANGGDCHKRVLRGGSWYHDPVVLRASIRSGESAGLRMNLIGFRLAMDLP